MGGGVVAELAVLNVCSLIHSDKLNYGVGVAGGGMGGWFGLAPRKQIGALIQRTGWIVMGVVVVVVVGSGVVLVGVKRDQPALFNLH